VKLYELTEAYRLLQDEEADYEVALEQIGDAFEVKAENVAKVIRELEAEAKAYEDEISRMAGIKTARENRVKSLKGYLQANMEAAGIEKVKGSVLSVGLQNSPPSCEIVDESQVPDDYKEERISIYINRKSITDALKAGGEIPGTVLTQSRHIRIR